MNVSVTIMASPSRRAFVDELLGQLDRPAQVVWDRHGDYWETGRRALLTHLSSGSDWALTVQDDAIPCRDLVAGIERALAGVDPDRPVSFYLGAALARKFGVADAAGPRWHRAPGPWGGVAIALPSAHIAELVAWGDDRPDIRSYDKRISRWYGHRGHDCLYAIPSLVDHRSGPSLMPSRRNGRRSANAFIGARHSALEFTP